MIGALLVIVLAGLIIPISLLMLAVVFDVIVLLWAAGELIRRKVGPHMSAWVGAHRQLFHLPHPGFRHR